MHHENIVTGLILRTFLQSFTYKIGLINVSLKQGPVGFFLAKHILARSYDLFILPFPFNSCTHATYKKFMKSFCIIIQKHFLVDGTVTKSIYIMKIYHNIFSSIKSMSVNKKSLLF